MCQHFSGPTVKQILAAFRSLLAINSYWRNEVADGYKKRKPRSTFCWPGV